MTQGPSDRRYKDAGFVGHMHRFTNGKTYDEFNQEWVVSTTTKDNSGDFDDACVQAFGRPNKRKRVDDDDGDDAWRCRCVPKPCASLARCRGKVDHLIVAAVDATAHAGTTVRDLVAKIVLPGGSLSVDEMQGRVNHLLAVEKLWDVHAYAEVRYVTKKHAGLWFVHPFAKDGCHVEFNRDEPALARPWLKMDGSVNEKFLVVVKRELTMLVVERPGINEDAMREYFKGLFGLQDTRCLCFQLIEDGVLYCRATKRSRASLFAPTAAPAQPVRGEYTMDRNEYALRYFAAIDCFGHLGNAVEELL
ncbi:Aste57867_222 [Aphanomyces stellatus]|uniref:Aste57867_222 protein n=1 Tax=Aphanomyces stellatus TaxID=120398 RepID=A0A485K712_9STRA|nr:hypothetical protein As57867_000222 [Aphanomyces stellatus]VFT77448.1 Aste57867_222 [Aphanomyces stellatus]